MPYKIVTPVLISTFVPYLGHAQTFEYIESGGTQFATLLGVLIAVFIALAFLVFAWGLVTFIFASGSDSAKEEGKRKMVWGVIALFVITAIWGILSVLRTITGTTGTTKITPDTWHSATFIFP